MPPRALFRGLFDDAAMFPPGNASAEAALAGHLRLRRSWFAGLVGPLLVSARSWDDFVRAHEDADAPEVAVVLIGTTSAPAGVPETVALMGLEVAVTDVPLPDVPAATSLAAEITLGPAGDRVLAAIGDAADPRLLAKFRTGGTTADAFPSQDVLASVICRAVAVQAPFKLTAGLHHAVRHTGQATGFEHHGFLNVIAAVSRALSGADGDAVAEALAGRHSAPLVAEIRELTAEQVRDVRESFVSFGCCGVEDPVGDLVELGLVAPDPEELE